MANTQKVVKCRTKLNADDKNPVTSEVTVVFDEEKATQDFAARGAVIAWQALCRMAGVIPEAETVNISDLAKRSGGGFKATPASIANRVKKMPEAEYRETLQSLGLDAKTIERMVKTHLANSATPAPTSTKTK